MKMNLVDDLKWRGLIQDMTPETDEYLNNNKVSGYVGFDPTSDSLHIGNLVPVMLLMHLQKHGHTPVALVGGATGMIGDPSGKKAERAFLSEEQLRHNERGIAAQLRKFLDFDRAEGAAVMVNNYDWFKDISLLDFLRSTGKHLTVNYMMSKDSVKSRLETGISFTEFTYQLIQGYDFLHLHRTMGVHLQMGGSDQWGNMTAGTELIRRTGAGDAYALTAPLITKADGSKFGKSEGGNIWLDAERTSPYRFYQYWLNAADEDAVGWIKLFSMKEREEIEAIIQAHQQAPHERRVQRELAEELTIRIHSEEALARAQTASSILFGRSTEAELRALSVKELLDVFSGVPLFEIPASTLTEGVDVVDLLAVHTAVFGGKGEARRMIQSNAVSINKEKVSEGHVVNRSEAINDEIIVVQKGKKNYFLIRLIAE
jgi:tyrosyl-tRNA synthetase